MDEKKNGVQPIQKKHGSGAVFIRDKAQEQTLDVWRKAKADVYVTLSTGIELHGQIVKMGPFSIHFRMHNDPRDVCLFKTGIVAVFGPRIEDTKAEAVTIAPGMCPKGCGHPIEDHGDSGAGCIGHVPKDTPGAVQSSDPTWNYCPCEWQAEKPAEVDAPVVDEGAVIPAALEQPIKAEDAF